VEWKGLRARQVKNEEPASYDVAAPLVGRDAAARLTPHVLTAPVCVYIKRRDARAFLHVGTVARWLPLTTVGCLLCT
jgi:hypothetical protein